VDIPSWRILSGPSHKLNATLFLVNNTYERTTNAPCTSTIVRGWRDGYKVPSVVYKNQRSTYTYKLSNASPLSSLHGKMGENSDGRTAGEILLIQTTQHPTPP